MTVNIWLIVMIVNVMYGSENLYKLAPFFKFVLFM